MEDITLIFNRLKTEKHKLFMEKIIPGADNIIGVPSEEIRKISKIIYKDDWKLFLDNFYNRDNKSYERSILQGMIIGLNTKNLEESIYEIKRYVPYIDNWALCDSFCSSLKIVKKNKIAFFNLIEEYLKSHETYDIRFAIVLLLDYYIDIEYIDKSFDIFEKIDTDEYYIEMAIAWAISKYFFTFPEKTLDFLRRYKKNQSIYKKALQKILDSRQVSLEFKNEIRNLKKENTI